MKKESSLFDTSDIKSEVETSNFNVIEYMNEILPNERSLLNLKQVKEQIENQQQQNIRTLQHLIRADSNTFEKDDIENSSIILDAQKSIEELNIKIQNIQNKGKETEELINRICVNIKPLDNAKKNLMFTITSLRRLQMLIITLNEFENNVKVLDYLKASKNILALSSLFQYFHSLNFNQHNFLEFNQHFSDLKRVLRNKINTEFNNKLYQGYLDESNLPLCYAIDSFQDDFKASIIEFFCEKNISEYDELYSKSPLNSIHLRFQWFKQKIDSYNSEYQKGFPKDWMIPYYLSIKFCKRTYSHLANLFKLNKPKISDFIRGFELTIKFEQKMNEVFINNKQNQQENKIEISTKDFKGLISNAFLPYIELFFDEEYKKLNLLINEIYKDLNLDLNKETHILNSSSKLIVQMKKSIEKISIFNNSQILYRLFLMLKDLIIQYINNLTKSLTSLKPKKSETIQITCSIINTTSILLPAIESLSNKIKDLIHDDNFSFKIEESIEIISNELRKQIFYLTDMIIKEIDIYLYQIINFEPKNNELTNIRLPEKLILIFQNRFEIIDIWLSSENISRFRIPFIQKIVEIIHDYLFKSKLPDSSIIKIILLVKELKGILIQVTKADSQLSLKRVNNEFSFLENELNILNCTNSSIIMAYFAKIQKKSKENFLSIIRIKKSITPEIYQQFSNEYDKQLH